MAVKTSFIIFEITIFTAINFRTFHNLVSDNPLFFWRSMFCQNLIASLSLKFSNFSYKAQNSSARHKNLRREPQIAHHCSKCCLDCRHFSDTLSESRLIKRAGEVQPYGNNLLKFDFNVLHIISYFRYGYTR